MSSYPPRPSKEPAKAPKPRKEPDYDDDEGGRPGWMVPAILLFIALIVGVLVWDRISEDDKPTTQGAAAPIADELPEPLTPSSDVGPAAPDTVPAPAQPPAIAIVTTSAAPDTTVPPTTEPPATTQAPATTVPAAEAVTYPTLPDGSPQPVLAVFSPNQVVVSGLVPSEEAKAKLIGLALANSRDPENTVVNSDFLGIDPTIPPNIGVRVIETTSTRFDSGKSDVVPGSDHAKELDRIGVVMKAFPNVTALIIGHADPRGSDDSNYRLSAARAQSVVDYLVSTGIQASRLSSRAVGEADVLTLNSDETALALNRRTEFTLYGLLLT